MPIGVTEHTGVTATIDTLPIPVLSVSSTSQPALDRCTHPWQLITEDGINRLLGLEPGSPRQRPRC
jgi:hypothetical protein